MEHVQYDFSSERALLGEESGLGQALNATGVNKSDDPARLMVAAACACAEQAERNRGATTRVTSFFSPALSRALAPFASAALVASGVADPTARGSTAPSGLSRLAVSPSSAARAAARYFPSDANANANAWLASQASPPFGPPFGPDGLRSSRVASGAEPRVAPFFDIATAGYDPLSVSMVPQRRSADLPRDALASPGVNGSLLRVHTAPHVPANVEMPNVSAVASRLKIEDAEDVLDEGSPRLRSPKASPRAPVATARRVGRGWGRAVRSVRDAGAGGGRAAGAGVASAAGARLGRERRGDALARRREGRRSGEGGAAGTRAREEE